MQFSFISVVLSVCCFWSANAGKQFADDDSNSNSQTFQPSMQFTVPQQPTTAVV
jgi:hypothetical protein